MRLGREFMAVLRGSTPNHLHLRNRLSNLIIFVAVIDLIAGLIMYALEKDAPGSDIHNWGDAFFWTTAQLLTVSSSMSNPVTGGGMVLDVVIMLVAVTLVAALAATFGSFLYKLTMESAPHPLLDEAKALLEKVKEEQEKPKS